MNGVVLDSLALAMCGDGRGLFQDVRVGRCKVFGGRDFALLRSSAARAALDLMGANHLLSGIRKISFNLFLVGHFPKILLPPFSRCGRWGCDLVSAGRCSSTIQL